MASKQVVDRERSSGTVASMLDEYAEQAGNGVEEALRSTGQRIEAASVTSLLNSCARHLEVKRNELVDADALHEAELSDDAQPREERDEARENAFELIFAIRGTVESVFGDTGLRALGLWEPCPDTPQGTASYGRNLVKNLGSKKVKLPKAKTKNVGFKREQLAEELGAAVKTLEKLLKRVASEESEAKGTQARKDEAIAAHDEAFRIVTGVATGLFRLGGLGQVADRIKPSSRRPGTLESNDPQVDTGGPTGAA